MKLTNKFLFLGLLFLACFTQSAFGYRLNSRWTNTASGPTGALGDPVTLTWGFALDGTTIPTVGVSELIAWADSTFGAGSGGNDLTQRPWFSFFDQSFERWGQLSGASYIYEPNDDGVTHGSLPGQLGMRADMRIGGGVIDGPSNTLAFNNFPNNGDMVLDTSDTVFYSSFVQNYRRLRNVIMHEHGHGAGLSHVESVNGRFLMEPIIQTTFDGPQLDDIRGMQRHYGDFFEKSNAGAGNDTFETATSLGALIDGLMQSIGTDATSTVVAPAATDFVSIDDDSDIDFFSFIVSAPSLLDIVLTPLGPTYREGPQGGAQSILDSSAISDLSLTLFGTDGMTPLAMMDSIGVGGTESILAASLPAAGQYYARVAGTANDIQMYQLDLSAMTVPEPSTPLYLLLIWAAAGCARPTHRF